MHFRCWTFRNKIYGVMEHAIIIMLTSILFRLKNSVKLYMYIRHLRAVGSLGLLLIWEWDTADADGSSSSDDDVPI